MSNNMSEIRTRQQGYRKKQIKIKEISNQYYEDNKERLQKMNRDRCGRLSKEETNEENRIC